MSFRNLAAVAAVALAGSASAPALAQDVTLTVHHFLSPQSPTHASFIQPWADRIEEQSDGRIAVEIFPAMSLGGRPPELYSQVRDGVADIVWTLIGYTPGVFPRAEVFELPTVHRGSAAATNQAIQDLMPLLADDFADIVPLLVHVHAGNALHMRDGVPADLSDLAGLRLRTPTRTGSWMIEALGAEPVGMPVPELPQALSRGNVDGALIPFEVMLPLRVHELTESSVELADGERFGTSVFLYAMNRDRYQSLPEDLRAIIDANSGVAIAADVGAVWDGVEAAGIDAQTGTGGTVAQWDDSATADFQAIGDQVVSRWVEEVTATGIDGASLVEAARAAVAGFSE